MKPKFLTKIIDITKKSNKLTGKLTDGIVDGLLKKGEELMDEAEKKLDSASGDSTQSDKEESKQAKKIDKSEDVDDKDFM